MEKKENAKHYRNMSITPQMDTLAFLVKSDTYTMSAYLIAQLGKNFSESGGTEITGAELLKLAWDKIKEIQYLGGGVVTFLEAENEEKLLSFYRDNRFSQFDTRQTASDTDEAHELVQLLRLL